MEENYNTPSIFKPNDDVALWFGNQLLNGKVEWREILEDILRQEGWTLTAVAQHLDAPLAAVHALLNHDPSGLDFHQGARLLSLHLYLIPEEEMTDMDRF